MYHYRAQLGILATSAAMLTCLLTMAIASSSGIGQARLSDRMLAITHGTNATTQQVGDLEANCADRQAVPGVVVGNLRCGDKYTFGPLEGQYINVNELCHTCANQTSSALTSYFPNGQDPGFRDTFPINCGELRTGICNDQGECFNPTFDPDNNWCVGDWTPKEHQD